MATRVWMWFAACSFLLAPAPVGAADPAARDPAEVVREAKRRAQTIPKQAEALAALAWPTEGARDFRVQAAARGQLVHFGNYALPVLRRLIREADPLYVADVTAALIEARRVERSGSPPDYLPGLEEAIWFGSIEAKRIAMIELSRYPFPPAVLSIIDAIHDHPELTFTGLHALGRMRDERARFFLGRVVRFGDDRYKNTAAMALGLLGETGVAALREALGDDKPPVREAAMRAYLPYASTADLTLLYEYLDRRASDDAEVLELVRERALQLEDVLLEEQLSEAASSEPGDGPPTP